MCAAIVVVTGNCGKHRSKWGSGQSSCDAIPFLESAGLAKTQIQAGWSNSIACLRQVRFKECAPLVCANDPYLDRGMPDLARENFGFDDNRSPPDSA
jgi:hypothetical protein